MNNTELTSTLISRLQLSKTEVALRIDNIVSCMSAELLDNNIVAFGDFGTLEVQKRDERISVNPVSGKKMLSPPKLVVKFKVAAELKDKLKNLK
jgi:DNA-binding protein HU-beta